VSHLQQGTVYSLIACIYEYTVVEWPHTSDEYHGWAPWDLVAAAVPARSVMLICAIFNGFFFFIIDNQLGILNFYKIRQLPCRARGARAHNIFSHLLFRMDSCVHGNRVSVRYSIDWGVQYKITKCWMHWLNMSHNITVYIVANLEIRLSVYVIGTF